MTEIEVPLEKVQEDIHHAATHRSEDNDSHNANHNKFTSYGALLSAFLAVFAAIAALQAGHAANEAMIEQIESSDQWAFYQAKGIKASITELKAINTKDKTALDAFNSKIKEYKEDQMEIKKRAEEKADESKYHLKKHETLAKSVTIFQIAIAMIAIAILTRRRQLMWVSLLFAIIGTHFLTTGLFIL